MNSMKFRFVVATKESQDDFFDKCLLGKNLILNKQENIELDLYSNNSDGLAKVYNKSIENSFDNPAILIFAHDDIYLTDYYWSQQLSLALEKFDLVGVAGNRRRLPYQPSWAFINEKFTWDTPINLSGMVGHGKNPYPDTLSVYGAPGHEVKLLDGLFLACSSETIINSNIRFDERFNFHFYDLDFCRTAELKGVRMGTWPISIVHKSGGNFNSPEWNYAKELYFEKWIH